MEGTGHIPGGTDPVQAAGCEISCWKCLHHYWIVGQKGIKKEGMSYLRSY